MKGPEKEEQQILERLKADQKATRGKPTASTPAPRADRFSDPIGVDDKGRLVAEAPPTKKRPPKKH